MFRWYVVNTYFRSFFVWIPVKVILFHSIPNNPFSIPFPGGWLLGGREPPAIARQPLG